MSEKLPLLIAAGIFGAGLALSIYGAWLRVRRHRAVLQTDVWVERYKEGQVAFIISWNPDTLPPEAYAELVVALGDMVRARGGNGVFRAVSRGVINEDRTEPTSP